MKTEPNASLAVAPPTPRGRLEFYLRNVLMPAMPTMTSQASSDTVRGAVWFVFDCDPPDATPVDIVATISSAVANRSKRRDCEAALADDVLQQYKQQAAALKKLSDRNARLHEQLQTAKDELASLEALHALEMETHAQERDGLETQLRDLQDQVHGADEQNDSMMENLITAERDSMAECESLRMERDAQSSWNSSVANWRMPDNTSHHHRLSRMRAIAQLRERDARGTPKGSRPVPRTCSTHKGKVQGTGAEVPGALGKYGDHHAHRTRGHARRRDWVMVGLSRGAVCPPVSARP